MIGSLTLAIREATDNPDPVGRAEGIKTAVAGYLASLDRGAQPRTTEYFNHTFAPDIIVRWPRENRERMVYLRPNPDPAWLADDLGWVSASKPILLMLEVSAVEREQAVAEQVKETAQSTDTLVTDPRGLDEVGSRPSEPFSSLLAHAVLRGGRGVVDDDFARRTTATTTRGFLAAQRLDAAQTGSAVEAVEQLLDRNQAGRLTRVLQSVWEGHGGSASSFPASRDLRGALTEEDIELLLETTTTEDLGFWARVGRTVSLDQLGRLTLTDPSPSLQMLLRANLDRVSARALRILTEPLRLGESADTPRWLVSRGCLALRGWDWTAYFATSREHLPAVEEHDPLPVTELRHRATTSTLPITHVQIRRRDLAITYDSMTDANIVDEEEMIDESDRPDARAQEAAVSVPPGRRLVCDFLTMTAGSYTKATFAVGELARTAIPLLRSLSGTERAALDTALAPMNEIADETLF